MKKIQAALLAVSLLVAQGVMAAAPTLDFGDATNVAGQAAGGVRDTFYAVLPIGLVVGLTIIGWRFARRLAR